MNNETAVLEPVQERVIASKPTPGPYNFHPAYKEEVRFFEASNDVPARSRYHKVIAKDEIILAEIEATDYLGGPDFAWPQVSHQEAAANANLFLAAPDLLEAAQFYLDECLRFADRPVEFEAARLFRAAIAKAHGQVE